MQRRPKVARPRVDLTSILHEQLYQVNVALVAGHVKRRPPVTVTLVDQRLSEGRLFGLENLHASHHFVLLGGHPNLAKQLSLSLFLINGCALSHFVKIIFGEVFLCILLLFLLSHLRIIKHLLRNLLLSLEVWGRHLRWIDFPTLRFGARLCLMLLRRQLLQSCGCFIWDTAASLVRELTIS